METCNDCFWYNGGFCDWWITRADPDDKPCEFFDPMSNYLSDGEEE